MTVLVGTAGWTIPRQVAEHFPRDGTSLERYASRFAIAEINSSFHRRHRLSTWERWRDSVPDDFRFSVKLPKTITHQHKLVDCQALLAQFLNEACILGDKLAVLLVQLPPKLALDPTTVEAFFELLADHSAVRIVCEPRNASWFGESGDSLLDRLGVARVAADPALCDAAARPGGWGGLTYWRLHGSPHMYRSSYADRIDDLANQLRSQRGGAAETWCILDNTASSAAANDALLLIDALVG